MNLWRSILDEPIETFPLAICNAESIQAEDFCVFEIHYADRVGENYFACHNTRHDWLYFPRMVRDEALLIKQWDSHGTLNGGPNATLSMHSAFLDPTANTAAKDRESIEVRTICVFGAQPEAKL